MTFQAVFIAKNVPMISFWLLVAPKLKNQGGHNGPSVYNVFSEHSLDKDNISKNILHILKAIHWIFTL